MTDTPAFQAKYARLWYGTGDQSMDFETTLSSWDIQANLNLQSKNVSGPSDTPNYYPITLGWTLPIEMYMYTDPTIRDAQLDLYKFWMNDERYDADAILDLSGVDDSVFDFIGWRKIIPNSVSLAGPFDDIISLRGTIFGHSSTRGVVTPTYTLTNSALTPVVANEAIIPTGGAREIWILSEASEGTVALSVERKRGTGAWSDVQYGDEDSPTDESVTATDRKAGSVYRIKTLESAPFLAADRVRVRFPTGTAAGNSWRGKIAVGKITDLSS